ncbi:MAG: thiamine pyrophosphate-dependent enzyme, partial [Acidilobaceae archaeon]
IIGTLLGNPSFEALAKAFGARGVTVADDSEIDEAINEMLESDKPFVVDLRISQEDIPPLNIEASIRIAE